MGRALFPAFLDLVGRRVLVVGGGSVAAAKIPRLLQVGAHVVVVAPAVHPAIPKLSVEIHRRPFTEHDLRDAWYVVSAAPRSVNAEVLRAAEARGIFVNAVDDPQRATAFAGSVFTRGPVTVALSTGGEAPALARLLREALERLIGRDVEDWASLARALRHDWRREDVPMGARTDALLATLARLHDEARRHTTPGHEKGFVSLVGAGPGDPELLTRKAARRLAEADLVLYDALVAPAILSLARHAQRIFVGRRAGTNPMGQTAVVRTLIRAARRGKRVVRLKGGDPFVFGRGGEEALELAAAGVDYEVVPGISSSLAAPAAAGIPVTQRGVSAAVLITTGHDTERFQQLADGVEPGKVTLVVMMGTANRDAIRAALISAGWPPFTPAAIVRAATLPEQTVWRGALRDLALAPDSDAPGTIVIGKSVALGELLAADRPEIRKVCHA